MKKAEDLTCSKHNPWFSDRTLSQRLEIEDILASFHRQLHMIVKTEDQNAFNDLYLRIKMASLGYDERILKPSKPDVFQMANVSSAEEREPVKNGDKC